MAYCNSREKPVAYCSSTEKPVAYTVILERSLWPRQLFWAEGYGVKNFQESVNE